MARTKLRDIEICVEEGRLKVIPYKLTIDKDSYFHADTSTQGQGKILDISMNRKDNKALIDYILECDHTLRGTWEDFTEWDTTERFFDNPEPMPERLRNWVEGLPFYEIKMVA